MPAHPRVMQDAKTRSSNPRDLVCQRLIAMAAFNSLDWKYVTWQIQRELWSHESLTFCPSFWESLFLLSYGEWNMIAMMLDITPFQAFQPVSKSMLHRFMGERLIEWDIALMIMLGSLCSWSGECFAWIGFKPHSCYHTLQKNKKSIITQHV